MNVVAVPSSCGIHQAVATLGKGKTLQAAGKSKIVSVWASLLQNGIGKLQT